MFLGQRLYRDQRIVVRLSSIERLIAHGWELNSLILANRMIGLQYNIRQLPLQERRHIDVEVYYNGNPGYVNYDGIEINERLCTEIVSTIPRLFTSEEFSYYHNCDVTVKIKTKEQLEQLGYEFEDNRTVYIPDGFRQLNPIGTECYLGRDIVVKVDINNNLLKDEDTGYQLPFHVVDKFLSAGSFNLSGFEEHELEVILYEHLEQLPSRIARNIVRHSPTQYEYNGIHFDLRQVGRYLGNRVLAQYSQPNGILVDGILMPVAFIKEIVHWKGEGSEVTPPPIVKKETKKQVDKKIKLPSGVEITFHVDKQVTIGKNKFSKSDAIALLRSMAVEFNYLDLEAV